MAGLGRNRRKKKCIRYMREDGASTDGEDYDDESSRLGSQRSTCDTDSTHGDMDLDSPRPPGGGGGGGGGSDPSSSRRRLSSSFSQQHSPLSPLCPDDEDVDVVADHAGKMDIAFPPHPGKMDMVFPPPPPPSLLLHHPLPLPLLHHPHSSLGLLGSSSPSSSTHLPYRPPPLSSSPLRLHQAAGVADKGPPSSSSPSSTPVKLERPLSLTMSSPGMAAT